MLHASLGEPSLQSGLAPSNYRLNDGNVCPHRVPVFGLLKDKVVPAVAIFVPGVPVRWQHKLEGPIPGDVLPPTDPQEGFELRAEALVQPAVNEGVVASAAHGKPMERKVHGVVAVDGLAGDQDQVAIQGEPADGKDGHHHHQHLERHLLFLLVGIILLHRYVPDGVPRPQLLGHHGVSDGDHQQRQHIEQDEGGQVQVLPVKVGWRRKVGETHDSAGSVSGTQLRERSGDSGPAFGTVSI